MSCGANHIILDTPTKELWFWMDVAPGAELHITTHWLAHYTSVLQEENWHGFSDGTNDVVIVDSPANCFRRDIRTITVYNPNGYTVEFYISEQDSALGTNTIIVRRQLGAFETWTNECICSCCAPGPQWPPAEGINVYRNDMLVQANVLGVNVEGPCLTAVWDPVTSYVDISFTPSFTFDSNTSILDLCGYTVDLSILADTPLLNVYDDEILVLATIDLNFIGCLGASINPLIPTMVDVTFTSDLAWSGCNNPDPDDDYILSLCGTQVDLSCLSGPAPFIVENTVFVMTNGSDVTGTAERFDLPFATISAAITAASFLPVTPTDKNVTVVVYPGIYIGDVEMQGPVNLHLIDGAIIHGQLIIQRHETIGDVTGDGTIWINGDTNQSAIFVGDPIGGTYGIASKIELKDIILEQSDVDPQTMNIINESTTLLNNKVAVHSRHCYIVNTAIDPLIRPFINCVYTLGALNTEKIRTIDLAIDDFEIDCLNIDMRILDVGDYENIYIHKLNIHEGPILKSGQYGLPVDWIITNLAGSWSDIYRDNIFIEGIVRTNTARINGANAFIAVGPLPPGNTTTWSFNNTYFHFMNDSEGINGSFITGDLMNQPSANKYNFYGNNYVILGDSFIWSLYPGTLIGGQPGMFNCMGRGRTNKPYDITSMGWYMHQGIKHWILENEDIGGPFGPMEMPRQSF